MDTKNTRKRSAMDDLFQGAEKVPTPNERSTSIQQSVDMGDVSVLEEIHDPNLEERAASGDQSTVPGIISDLEKSDDSDQMKQASLDQLSTDYHIMSDPKKDGPELNEQMMAEQLSGSLGELSFVASHVTANFSYRSNIIPAHSIPAAKTERGKFQFTATNVSNLGRQFKFSPSHTIADLPWVICIAKRNIEGEMFLSVYIYCNLECASNLWSCDADIQLQLLSHDLERKPFVRNMPCKFNFSIGGGYQEFIQWSKLMDPQNEYVNNDEVTIEVQVTIKKIIGFREFSEFDFVSDGPGSNSDVLLRVGGQRLCVCKHYLSVYSPVFRAMFFSDFIERDKKEIILEDIEPNEFIELLHVIYPTHKPVTLDNVDFLLKLGDRFEVRFVIGECERFLIGTNEVSTPKKFIHANQYCLAKLEDICIKTIKGHADVQALKKDAEYNKFTSETKAAILDRLLKVL